MAFASVCLFLEDRTEHGVISDLMHQDSSHSNAPNAADSHDQVSGAVQKATEKDTKVIISSTIGRRTIFRSAVACGQ